MEFKDFQPQAVIYLTNTSSLEIMLNRSNDGVYYRFHSFYNNDLKDEPIFEAEIHYVVTAEQKEGEEAEAVFYHETEDNKNDPTMYSLNQAMKFM